MQAIADSERITQRIRRGEGSPGEASAAAAAEDQAMAARMRRYDSSPSRRARSASPGKYENDAYKRTTFGAPPDVR